MVLIICCNVLIKSIQKTSPWLVSAEEMSMFLSGKQVHFKKTSFPKNCTESTLNLCYLLPFLHLIKSLGYKTQNKAGCCSMQETETPEY